MAAAENPPQFYLASASERRANILRNLRFNFVQIASDIDESPLPGETPIETIQRLAQEKAIVLAQKIKTPSAVILAADTDGELDGELIGKPQDSVNAFRMLKKMAGRNHLVHSAFCICRIANTKNFSISAICEEVHSASVKMIDFDEELFLAYSRSGEGIDKSCSYAIQGLGAVLLEKVEGDFYSVVGLPVFAICRALRSFGIKPNF